MSEYDQKLLDLVKKSNELLTLQYESYSSKIRAQLMVNKECILVYDTYYSNINFNKDYLAELKKTQDKLELYHSANWKFNLINPYEMLKIDKLYCSQTYIYVEWHAGHAFHQLFKTYLIFHSDGFLSISSEKPNRKIEDVLERIKYLGKDYINVYELENENRIKFKIRDKIFEGRLLHDGIVGKNIRLGEYKDGIIEDKDEIFVLIN